MMENGTAEGRPGDARSGRSSPAGARLRLLRPALAAVFGAAAVAVCVSVIRPVPAESQRGATLPAVLLAVPATHPATTSASTAPSPTTAATTPRSTSGTTAYRPRTTYTTRQSPTTFSRGPASTDTTTTVAPTTTTTVAPLGGGIPAPPSTLPLTTKQQNGHVNPVFAELSGVGFFIGLALIAVQAVLTRRGGRGHSL